MQIEMSPSEHLTWYCLTTAYREGFRYSGEQSVTEKGYTCLLQNSSSSNLPLSLNHEFQCLVEPFMKELSIDFCIQYGYACSAAHWFSPSGRTTEKNQEEMGVCMCVCACLCVWRGVHGSVCVYK